MIHNKKTLINELVELVNIIEYKNRGAMVTQGDGWGGNEILACLKLISKILKHDTQ